MKISVQKYTELLLSWIDEMMNIWISYTGTAEFRNKCKEDHRLTDLQLASSFVSVGFRIVVESNCCSSSCMLRRDCMDYLRIQNRLGNLTAKNKLSCTPRLGPLKTNRQEWISTRHPRRLRSSQLAGRGNNGRGKSQYQQHLNFLFLIGQGTNYEIWVLCKTELPIQC